ncbi:hypothetical protein QFZ36_002286 [Pseudarthrobacter siccitolerans]|uniref:Uncharacterized protein n=1 Tax=Pseudarthrobacter siccitolerans TaxID=861266 RepID=A0ABU0PL73_9MICC|nr:hypothetical protein [Pseudarthrobacter siccitolerans]
MTKNVLWFSELGLKDLDRVGGKNASLGEMVQNLSFAGVLVPDGLQQQRMPTAASWQIQAWTKRLSTGS